jgi:hypothetical protein
MPQNLILKKLLCLFMSVFQNSLITKIFYFLLNFLNCWNSLCQTLCKIKFYVNFFASHFIVRYFHSITSFDVLLQSKFIASENRNCILVFRSLCSTFDSNHSILNRFIENNFICLTKTKSILNKNLGKHTFALSLLFIESIFMVK